MEVPYTTDYRSYDFIIDAYNKQITQYNFTGKTESTIEGTITSTTAKSNGTLSTVANLAGTPAKNLVNNIKTTGKVGEKIMGLINKIPSTGYSSAIKAGLGAIFGSATSNTVQDVKLKSTGTVTLQGSSTTIGENSVVPIQFNLYQAMNGTTTFLENNLLSEVIVMRSPASVNASELQYLGVWGKEKTPKANFYRYTYVGSYLTNGSNGYNFRTHYPYLRSFESDPVSINPALEPYITSRSITNHYVVWNKLNGVRRTHDDFSQLKSKFFYEDNLNEFIECKSGEEFIVTRSVPLPSNLYTYSQGVWLDWGKIMGGNMLKVIVVEINYNYMGKNHTITQSRTYPVNYNYESWVGDDDARAEGGGWILNQGFPICNFVNGVNRVTSDWN